MKPGLLFLLFLAGPLCADTLPPQSPARTNAPQQTVDVEKQSFRVKRGFRVELAASEPLVRCPIAMSFDENGRLFVLEAASRTAGGIVTGRVRMLEDSDINGVFGSSTVYAEDIVNPTAIICYGGGVFVAASGEILYLKDTKHNGVADIRREVFKSFGDPNNGTAGQVIITGLAWGLDNRIHAVTTGGGGDVISSASPSQSVVLTEGSFSFDPRTYLLVAESGSGATGICFDERGRKYICSSKEHIELVRYPVRYETQNPYYTLSAPDLVLGGAGAKLIYPATRVPLTTPVPVPFSSAMGIVIFEGNAYPAGYAGDAFAADTISGVIHHDVIRYDGIEPRLERAVDEQGSEFLGSVDATFQPTQVINAPDGTLYFTGISREQEVVIKTNSAAATAITKGRIYHIVPTGFQQPKALQVGNFTGEQLAAMLRNPNGWQRDTASRLIYERQDRSAIVPLIRILFDPKSPPLARMHALCALDGIELIVGGKPTRALLESHLLKALNDPDERVRERAVLLSENFLSRSGTWSDALWGQLSNMGNDTSPFVRWQLALTLGQSRNPRRAETLVNIARTDIKTVPAVLSALSEGAAEAFEMAAADPTLQATVAGQHFIGELLTIVGKKGDVAETSRVVTALQNVNPTIFAFELAKHLADTVAQQDGSLEAVVGPNVINPLYTKAAAIADDPTVSAAFRARALRLLAMRKSVDVTPVANLVRRWPFQEKLADRRLLMDVLLTRPEWVGTVVAALQVGMLTPSEFGLEQIRFLMAYPNESLRAQAVATFSNWDSLHRVPVVTRYSGALQMAGNVERGRQLFAANCQSCHRTGDESDVSAKKVDLTNAALQGKPALLTAILNPNGKGTTAHPLAILETKNGEVLCGFVTEQARSVTVSDAQGSCSIALSNVAAESPLHLSAMPEEWETTLTPQDMADLMEYLAPSRK